MSLFNRKQNLSIFHSFFKRGCIRRKVLKQTKKNKDIIYGARSIKRQIGIFGRGTIDWDIHTKTPKKSAKMMEKRLERLTPFDTYYVKKGIFPGLFKVMHKGLDMRKGTRDDVGVVDYTTTPRPRPPITTRYGVKYTTIPHEIKMKRKALKDKAFKFRWEKDRQDLARIKLARGR